MDSVVWWVYTWMLKYNAKIVNVRKAWYKDCIDFDVITDKHSSRYYNVGSFRFDKTIGSSWQIE
jgi:hypothetical protein